MVTFAFFAARRRAIRPAAAAPKSITIGGAGTSVPPLELLEPPDELEDEDEDEELLEELLEPEEVLPPNEDEVDPPKLDELLDEELDDELDEDDPPELEEPLEPELPDEPLLPPEPP